MGLATIVLALLLLLPESWTRGAAAQPTGGLREGFYSQSCPQAEFIARQTLQANLFLDLTAPAALLRLVFHDCQVQVYSSASITREQFSESLGCDGSVLLQSDFSGSIKSELLSDRSFGIRRLDFIDRIKGSLEVACPNTVSCADIIVMAGRDAVALSGGPFMQVLLGRRDGFTANNFRADSELPAATINVDGLINVFGPKGLTLEESVALIGEAIPGSKIFVSFKDGADFSAQQNLRVCLSVAGGHTLGVGHCVSFIERLYPQVDPAINPFMAGTLRLLCPNPTFFNNITFSANDLTNVLFDNQYFRDLTIGRGLLTIDNEISRDPRTSGMVRYFASNQGYFFQQFSSAYRKLTQHQVLTDGAGEIRRNCHFVNAIPQQPPPFPFQAPPFPFKPPTFPFHPSDTTPASNFNTDPTIPTDPATTDTPSTATTDIPSTDAIAPP
ncbi:hypothetical protein AXG93_40s1020 [Marchantia polymorpha subsp. ruderalis]|uniref:Plant heme peroxidase family profile domain-containing protein n=1 Tax=Marchantia polymorpha subsp. ruderalis TaxID=1480154 RepID=A0A176WBQ1_MARPO|nr:hypothetical protein AXG93_40s1020 [Marchantia polymorpha subsp. ruderalis]